MKLEFIILLVGLLESYVLIKSVYPNQTLIKLIVSTITVFSSQMILFEYYHFFGESLFFLFALILFLLIAGLILLNNRQLLYLDIDKEFCLGFFFLIIIGFISYIFPSFPSFFPLSRNADSAAHFEIVRSIAETNTIQYRSDFYPTGMHQIMAFIARLLDINPIHVIYPFIVIITVLTGGIIYGFIVESKISDKFFGLIPACILLSFFMTSYMTMVMGWWAMVFGIYLVLVFIWVLMDYIDKPSIPRILPLILIEIAIIFSYNFWALIPALTLFIILVTNFKISKKLRCLHFALFTLISGALTITSIHTVILSSVNTSNTGPSMSFLPFGFFNWRATPEISPILVNTINIILTIYFSIGIIGGINYIKNKKCDILIAFFIATFLQTFALGFASLFLGFDLYLYAKAYNLLLYPVTIFLWIIIKDVSFKWNNLHKIKDSSEFKLIFMIILSSFVLLSTYTMYIGIKSTGHQILAITPDQYDVASWTKDNLKDGNLTSLAEWPQGLWFTVISKRNFTSVDERYGVENAAIMKLKFDKWELNSRNGDTIAILDISKIDKNIEVYDILYRKGNSIILRKKLTME